MTSGEHPVEELEVTVDRLGQACELAYAASLINHSPVIDI